ncbi:MAG: hypothetical protein ACI94Y_002599 [Maribacter sp.]
MEDAKSNKKIAIGLIIVGIAFILSFGNMWINRNYEIKEEELISINGRIANQLELKWKKTVGNSLKIQLEEYPKIDFRIGKFAINRLNFNSLQNDVEIEDEIQLDIMKEDYTKLDLDKERTFSIYGLRSKNKEYLNVNDYNSEKKKDRNSISMYLILGFSFWMFGFGIFHFIEE